MKILVIGSFMMDLVVRASRMAEMGETVIGESFSRFPGGKGVNQAVAAARLGGQVSMAGKVGNDDYGDEFFKVLENENIGSSFVYRDDNYSTGTGSITLDKDGNNRITVVPGADLQYRPEELGVLLPLLQESDILILQLEMDLKVIEAAVTLAATYHVPIILNPAPARKLDDNFLKRITYLTPNESEAELLTGIKITSLEDAKVASEALLNKGVKNVIITLADKGAFIANAFGHEYVPGYKVNAVDTVAAGDSFNGALAVGIVSGKSLIESVRFANAVGTITVTREGAIPSLPRLEEVRAFIELNEATA